MLLAEDIKSIADECHWRLVCDQAAWNYGYSLEIKPECVRSVGWRVRLSEYDGVLADVHARTYADALVQAHTLLLIHGVPL
jgi:hypothetical protein